jgi:SAM-dependent methyltransferase
MDEIMTFREGLVCQECGSISRDRIMMWVLANTNSKTSNLSSIPENKNIRILESTATRGHTKILDSKFEYFNTIFDPNAIKENIDPKKYADFQKLHFIDNYFDYILASDVFEHIRLDDNAYSEVFRTLKPGGYFLMTVPFGYVLEESLIRVKPDGDKDIFLLPPEYHGDHTLSYRVYGRDLFKKLSKHGFHVCYLFVQIKEHGISAQEVFVCRKGNEPEMDFVENKSISILKKERY